MYPFLLIILDRGIRSAVEKAQAYLQSNELTSVSIEVETRTLEEAKEIHDILKHQGSTGSVKRVMLDNMTKWVDGELDISLLKQAIEILQGKQNIVVVNQSMMGRQKRMLSLRHQGM